MKKTIKFASLLVIALVVIVFFSFSTNPFSENKTPQLLAKANLFNMQFPQEKVYLHLDRSSYWASDDIWFKAYLKDSPIPDCNLYVELLNSTGTVIYKKICWAQNGLAYGDIHLEYTISTGVYQVRAYTNWMRNFEEAWFFRKDLVIVNLRDPQPVDESNRLRERKIDIQFFPEGGTFVVGLPGKVAFKVADQNGKGLDVEGRIVDDLGNEIVEMNSNFKGIGHFSLQPKEGRRYRAQVKVAGSIDLTAELPVPTMEGLALAVKEQYASQLQLQVARQFMAGTDHSIGEYTLVGQTKGSIVYRKNIALGKDPFNLSIQMQDLPNGIVQFTLFDQEALPVCERLVFINHKEVVNVDISTDKNRYSPREKVQLDLGAFNREGMSLFANLSMSVYHSDSELQLEKYPNNIMTHFLLGAELKGLIEEPGYYFKDDSLSTFLALDNLMLTHGYRHFEWKEIQENKYPEISYPAEECIQVRGTVKSIVLKKLIPNCSVTMMTVKSQLSVKEQKTDSLGRFVFSDLYFNDTIYVSIQAVNPRGRKNTVIELDKKASISPQASYLPVTYQYNQENETKTSSNLDEANENFIKRKWHLSDTILLNDIKIRGYQQKMGDGHFRMYVDADFVLDMKKQDDATGSIYDAIEGKIPGVRIELAEKAFYARNQPVMLYLDGIRADYELMSTFPSQMIDKVEYIRMAITIGVNYDGGVLFFYTKRGTMFANKPTDALGMKSSQVIGYSVIRQFYSPQYEPTLPPEMRNDYRSTLYWNPIVRTDSLGRAAVSFFNSDQTGEVKVVVEGVTADGKLCRGVGKYNVIP